MSQPRNIQEVLMIHVRSAQIMYDTYKRIGNMDKCRYQQGLIDGLERAIEVADFVLEAPRSQI